MHTPLRLLLTTAVLPVLAGCNLIIGANDYSVGASWGCLGQSASSWGAVTLNLQVVRLVDGTPVAGAPIKVCGREDVLCTSPHPGGTTTDANGVAVLTIPPGKASQPDTLVYFDLTDPAGTGGAGACDGGAGGGELMETLLYVSSPSTAPQQLKVEVGTFCDYASLVMARGGTADPTRGAIWVNALDCVGNPAPGVALSLDPTSSHGTDPFYFQNGSPIDTMQTDTAGIGGFADVGAGDATITATLVSNPDQKWQMGASVKAACSPSNKCSTPPIAPALTEVWLSP